MMSTAAVGHVPTPHLDGSGIFTRAGRATARQWAIGRGPGRFHAQHRPSPAFEQLALPARGGLAGAFRRCFEGISLVQFGNGEQGAGTHAVGQAGLVALGVDQEAEDVEQVDQVGGAFGGPVVGLYFAQLRRRGGGRP